MIVLKIVITILLFQATFAQTPPPPTDDVPCSDDQNNCGDNSYCYIYSETGQPYCAQSCELNNGGCGTDRCEMVEVPCFGPPCPPIVQCTSTSTRPPPVDNVTCSDDQNNCPNNSYCYIYSETGRPYCAQSCELNNGGCGTDQCEMITVECITAPCPPVVQCSPATEICDLPPVVGYCEAEIRRFFFNSTSQRCEVFVYGGCGGNANNFNDETECSRTCQPGPYTCSLQPESGVCLAAFSSYFYNVTTRSCEMFVYGGCGGNDNRFSTAEHCYSTCRTSNNICGLGPETGLCDAYIPSYFYNVTSKRCDKFIYGGCGGNDNRFLTLDQCQATCDIDVCTLQPEAGNCRGSFQRYYYNKFTRRCEKFIYGGCGGNGNRFSDIRNCEQACVSSEPTATTDVPAKNIVTVTFDSYDGDLDGLIAEFKTELMAILFENGIHDISIKIVNMSYTPDNGVQLSVVVYSGNSMINGDKIAALITENKDTFTVAVSNAIAGDETMASSSDDDDDLSGRAIAGIVVGIIVGLIFIVLLAIVILYFIKTRQETTRQPISMEKSDGLDNPIYSDNQAE